jgi:O-antigen/teichoic acid export membrane protein
MARHRAPVQAFRNFLSILLGFGLGAANNLIILPWAFGDNLDSWGLVRVAAAWAALLGPILAFGAPSAMNRFKGPMSEKDALPELNGTLIWPPVCFYLLFIALPALSFPEGVAQLLGLEGENRNAVRPIGLLAGIQAAQVYFAGFLSSRLKTAMATFAREFFFKFGYAILGVALGLGYLGEPAFLPAFVALHVVVLALLIAQSLANRFQWSLRGLKSWKIRKEVWTYGGTMVLGSSAIVILSQIDIIMVGRLLGLAMVPAFTIAVFISTVTSIPHRASARLLQPLLAKALHGKKGEEAWNLVDQAHRNMLLVGGWILTCIWVSMPEINRLLPEPFRGLDTVILAIGIARVLQGSAMGTNQLLGLSNHYRHTIGLNWTAVLLAVPLNLLLIPETGVGWGIFGAAVATLCAISTTILARQWIVWKIWKRYVPGVKTLIILVTLLVPGLTLSYISNDIPAILMILAKSGIVTAWVSFVTWRWQLSPEAQEFAQRKWAALRNRN